MHIIVPKVPFLQWQQFLDTYTGRRHFKNRYVWTPGNAFTWAGNVNMDRPFLMLAWGCGGGGNTGAPGGDGAFCAWFVEKARYFTTSAAVSLSYNVIAASNTGNGGKGGRGIYIGDSTNGTSALLRMGGGGGGGLFSGDYGGAAGGSAEVLTNGFLSYPSGPNYSVTSTSYQYNGIQSYGTGGQATGGQYSGTQGTAGGDGLGGCGGAGLASTTSGAGANGGSVSGTSGGGSGGACTIPVGWLRLGTSIYFCRGKGGNASGAEAGGVGAALWHPDNSPSSPYGKGQLTSAAPNNDKVILYYN